MRLAIGLCFSVLSMFAQNSAIQGVLTDSSGAVVSGAKVTVTNVETQVSRTTATNESGLYGVPLLAAGQYQVEVSAPGFATVSRPDLRLEVGQTARVDFEL